MDFYQKILFISCLLLFFEKSIDRKKERFVYKRAPHLKISKTFKNKELYKFFLATTAGIKIPFKKRTKEMFKNLNLLHLFTPSGIHLSSLFLILMPVLYFLSRYNQKIAFLITMAIFIMPWCLGSYYSIKRICLLHFSSVIIKKILKLKISSSQLFFCIFFLDFIFGTYSQGRLSFIYSFLFLGIIFSKSQNHIALPYLLLGGQILVSYFSGYQLTLLGPILGFFITMIFSLIFPILISYHFLSYFINFNYTEFIIDYFFKIIEYANNLAITSGYYSISLPLMIAIFFITTKKKKFIPFLVLIHSNITS